MRQIRQGTTQASLFLELQQWCRDGAGSKGHSLHFLSAFASGPGIEALEPFFDVFLSDGNTIDIIVGIDRGGTSRDAIKVLHELQQSHSAQVVCKVFHAPSRSAIFHPKLYLYKKPGALSAIVGSGNLTLGGLAHNFESLYLYEDLALRSKIAEAILATWNTFAVPMPPLQRSYLRALTNSYAKRLYRELPTKPILEKLSTAREKDEGIEKLWKPISSVKLPRSKRKVRRRSKIQIKSAKQAMVIDVLTETRGTQMQLPLAVVEKFFGVPRRRPAEIGLGQVRGGELTQPIQRPIVISSGHNGTRLMRRIEMPQISGLKRPLIALFLSLGKNQFTYVLLRNGSAHYRRANRLLNKYGQQPDHAQRRYLIGGVVSMAANLFRTAARKVQF